MKHIKGIAWKTMMALRGNSIRKLREFERMQWLDREKTAAMHEERLAALLMHAYNHVPYYKDILVRAGVIRNGCINMERFRNIPLLDKSIIRRNFAGLKSDDLHVRKWYENTSGGSTGEPARFVQDKDYHDSTSAITVLHDLWSGYEMGQRKAILWGSERDLFVGRETLRKRAGRWLRSEKWLNAFRITPAEMRSYVKCINDFRPVQILAYCGSIYELARFIERERLRVYTPRSIMVSAGILYPHMREKIESAFGAPVFNRYGSREVGSIACECERHQGLHAFPYMNKVEILRQDGTPCGPGETGEIVITNMTNYAMPLIRYRIGDVGSWPEKACGCGRAWPVLQEVTGRVSDTFVTKSGAQIHGEYFTHLFYFRDWVDKFQVIQEERDFLRILIVPREAAGTENEVPDGELASITDKILFVMGQDCRVEYNLVDDIDPTASGKYRYTISRVSTEMV